MKTIRDLKGFVIDMDGVLWLDDDPLPGLAAFFAVLRRAGKKFVLATNNNTRNPHSYVERLAGYGIQVFEEEVLTASQATVDYLKRNHPPGARVHMLAEQPFKELVAQAGYTLADSDAQAVIVTMDRQVTYDKLRIAALLVRQGAEFIGANPDVCYPTPQGMAPGGGTFVAAVAAAAERQPLFIGKPEPWMFHAALRCMNLLPHEAASIGDRLQTDIQGAQRAGMRSILVLSGVTCQADLADSAIRPDWVLDDIAQLTRLLE